MSKLEPTEQQSMTAHITRTGDAKLPFRVWLGMRTKGETKSLTEARKLAQGTKATELTECWEKGKTFLRTPRGAWKVFK